jgi:hypothetical protein
VSTTSFAAPDGLLKSWPIRIETSPSKCFQRHVPDQRETLGRGDASPGLAIERVVAALQSADAACSELSLVPAVHARQL